MKLFSKVLLISVAVCSTLVLAAEDDQSKASNSTKDVSYKKFNRFLFLLNDSKLSTLWMEKGGK